jgi:hypothetical protein
MREKYTPEEFNEAARQAQEYHEKYNLSHHATADDVQQALHLITAVAGFDVDAMAKEHIRKGHERFNRIMAEHPDIKVGPAPVHEFFFRRGENEELILSWNYEDNSAEVSLNHILPGEALARRENRWDFSLAEFAEFVASGRDPAARPNQSPAPRL